LSKRRTATRLTIADHYDAELRRYNEWLQTTAAIGREERVLDIGCGAGQSTRDAGRAASAGSVLGIDINEEMIERARLRTAKEGPPNVRYTLGDAEVYPFVAESFDVAISRFGTMFFSNPVGAFTNIASALRQDARLVMMVWQAAERNEAATKINCALTEDNTASIVTPGADPFSLGDSSYVRMVLQQAGFFNIGFSEVREPVYYGADVDTAYDIVLSFKHTISSLAALTPADSKRTLKRLRSLLAKHATNDGVYFDSRAWIVTAQRHH
jgi:SAM-dependent methyltransferase